MAVPPARLAAARTLPIFAAFAVLALAACASDQGFPPKCPVASIPQDFNDLHRYRGAGRDIVDSVLEGRITNVGGACRWDGDAAVVATVSVGLELSRGPAATSRQSDVAYFVAVSKGDRILDKQVFRLHAAFPENTERLRLTGDEIELRLPVTAKTTAEVYRISVGFELTPAELALNRDRIARHQQR